MTRASGPTDVDNSHADGASPIEMAANDFTAECTTDPVVSGECRLPRPNCRAVTLFGAHPGSVRVRDGVDLIAPALEDLSDAETGRDIDW